MTTTVLIDGNSLWWRVFSVAPYPAMAEYRFLEILCRLNREINPDQIIVTWDSWCQWRRDIHPDYKKHRGRTEEMLKKRDEVYGALNKFLLYLQFILPCYFGVDSEADDVIGFLCNIISGKKVIYGSDHDLFQLISDDVSMRRVRFKPTRVETVTKDNLRQLEGFSPHQAKWVQAICGCSSDNVPGSRVPQKLVVQILDQWNSETMNSILDLLELGVKLLTSGWAHRWSQHFQFQMAKNLKLVNLNHKVALQIMYQPDVNKAQEYLRHRKFITIEEEVIDNLLCAF